MQPNRARLIFWIALLRGQDMPRLCESLIQRRGFANIEHVWAVLRWFGHRQLLGLTRRERDSLSLSRRSLGFETDDKQLLHDQYELANHFAVTPRRSFCIIAACVPHPRRALLQSASLLFANVAAMIARDVERMRSSSNAMRSCGSPSHLILY